MSKKKKIIIISAVFLAVVIVGVAIAFCILKSGNHVVEENVQEETTEKISFKDELSISLEDELPTIEDYLSSGKLEDGKIIYKNENDEEVKLEKLKIGTFKVFIDDEEVSVLKIIDEVKPELKLKEVTINEKDSYEVKDFVESCTDNSKEECILSFKEEGMGTYIKEGTYDIVIVVKDGSENTEEQSTKLIIRKKEESKTDNNKNNSSSKAPSTQAPAETPQTSKDPNTQAPTETPQTSKDPNTQVPTETPQPPEVEPEPITEESYAYGTKITKITYSNGRVEYKYDYSTFNGNTNSMKGEASKLVGTNNGIYNEVLNYTNVYRSEVGASRLTLDNNLSLAATIRAMEMAYANKFSHDRPNGSNCFTVMTDLGINNYLATGENIASGFFTPKSVTVGWRNSPGHYSNMINTNFTKLGVGYYKLGTNAYYVQMFAN